MNSLKNHQKPIHNCSLVISLLKENLCDRYPTGENTPGSIVSFLEGNPVAVFVIIINLFRDS